MLYRDQGVVLRTYKLGESDRIIVVLTQGHGKVRAVAKGVRKTKSRFGARLEPLTHVAFQCYEGRQLDTVTEAALIDHFRNVREDLDRVGRGVALLEAADQVAQEREPHPRLYQMLVGALRSLAAGDAPLLVPAFFLKLLSIEGAHPLLDHCAVCGAIEDLAAFALADGGVICGTCHLRGHGAALSGEALDLIRLVLGGGLVRALQVPSGRAVREVEHVATASLEMHLERRLRVPGALERG